MMVCLTCLGPEQVRHTMSRDQQQAALAFLLASRSGSGFLHDINHQCGDLSRISAPTLILESKYDGSKDLCHATYAADQIANAELFFSPAEIHLFWFSSHDREIRAKMQEFLHS
jgi:hypothetical protein